MSGNNKAKIIFLLSVLIAGGLFYVNIGLYQKASTVDKAAVADKGSKNLAASIRPSSEEGKAAALGDCELERSFFIPGFISGVAETYIEVTQNLHGQDLVHKVLLDEATVYELSLSDGSQKEIARDLIGKSDVKEMDNVVAVVRHTNDPEWLQGLIIRKISISE